MITIYDIQMKVDWRGATSDGTDVAGKLSIPEVSHEITLDKLSDYVVCFPIPDAKTMKLKCFDHSTTGHWILLLVLKSMRSSLSSRHVSHLLSRPSLPSSL